MPAYPLKGGLDLRTGVTQVSPGTLADCQNYEVVGVSGYTRINGFERFDGQFRVADFRAVVLTVTVTAGTLFVGDVVAVDDDIGHVTANDRAGLHVLFHSRAAWPMTLPAVLTSGIAEATVTAARMDVRPVGLQSAVNTARSALAEAARPLVGPVPGNPSLPIAGMFWFKNRLYAIRDYPRLPFESVKKFPFRSGDSVTLPGGTFTVTDAQYTDAAYLSGVLTLWPLQADGLPMLVMPQPGDIVAHKVDANGTNLVLAALGEASFGLLGSLDLADTSAVVTAAVVTATPSTDEPVMRQARAAAGLWKATATGWAPVDLKLEVQFGSGTNALGTFVASKLGAGSDPMTTSSEAGTAALLNGVDATAELAAADGTVGPIKTNPSDEIIVTGFDSSAIPDTATILGVSVSVTRASAVGGKVKDQVVELVGLDGASTNKAAPAAWDTTATAATYGGSTDTWGNDNLTPAIVKNAAFGVRLRTQAVDATPNGGVDSVAITITYRRRDASVFAWDGTNDIPFNLVDVAPVTGEYADGDVAGWMVVDVPGRTYSPMLGNSMQVRSASNGGGDLLATLTSSDARVRLPGWTDLRANQSRYRFLPSNFYGMAEYAAVYGVSGASPAFTYDGSRWLWVRTPITPAQDLPRHIARQGASLVLGYYSGAYVLSVAGNPVDFSGAHGAASIEIGERLTGLMPAVGDALLVTSPTSTRVLHGTTPDDYQQAVVSGNRGALEFTSADVGRLLVTDQFGVAAADATQVFGDFTRTYLSMAVETWLAGRLRSGDAQTKLLCAQAVRQKNQYRMYFADGYVLTMTVNEPVEFTLQRYFAPGAPDTPFPIASITSGMDSDGRERLFAAFDASNRSYVFELDQGTTFDGAAIPAFVAMNPLAFGDSTKLKRFDRFFVQGLADGRAQLGFSRSINYTAPDGTKQRAFTLGDKAAMAGVRPARGEVDAPVEGYEASIRIDSNSATESPHTLQSIAAIANPRGTSRGNVRA